MATRTPGIGQQLFPEMPEAPFAEVHPEARNALARVLTPGYVGLHPERYQDITEELVDNVSAAKLRPSLIGVKPNSSGAVSYPSAETRRTLHVAVTPREFGLLSGSVRTLGERAIKRVEDSAGYVLRSAADPDKAKRAGIHAVEGRMTAMQKLDGELVRKIELIGRFAEAGGRVGLARFGSEAKMRQQFTYLGDFIFTDMFAALRGQRDWTPAQVALNKRALEASIFMDRPGNKHIANFTNLLALLSEWKGHTRAVIASRLYQSRHYIGSISLHDAE